MMQPMIRFFGFLFSALSIAAIAGIASIALIFWVYDRDLPDYDALSNYEPATLSRVYSGEGAVIAEFARERRIFTPIDEIPDVVKNAFISAEDKNFYLHTGVDGFGVIKAMVDNVRRAQTGQRLRGASTITQQVIKNFLLSEDSAVERKIKEFILSSRIEGALTKDQILELYLNEIFLGQNAYGVTAAARRYFGRTLEELSPQDAAYLASLPKAPSSYHPVRQREAALARRGYVLEEMAQNGHLTREDAEAAKQSPLATLQSGEIESKLPPVAKAGYFTEEVRRQLTEQLGETLYEGGLAIRSTIDPQLQEMAEAALRKKLESWDRAKGGYRGPLDQLEGITPDDEAGWRTKLADVEAPRDIKGWHPAVVTVVGKNGIRIGIENVEEDADGHYINLSDVKGWARPRLEGQNLGPTPKKPSDVWTVGDVIHVKGVTKDDGSFDRWSMRQVPELQGGFMAMDPATGRVLALVGGFSHDYSVFNRATQAKRQPGSSFKPFVYAAALDNGYSPATVVLDAPVVINQGTGQAWKPKNYSKRFYGPSPLRLGLEKSRNLMTVRLAQDVGMATVADYAERFGVYDDMPAHLSFSLGAGETTLYKMVAAYGMFANGGRRVEPTLVDRIQGRRGETIYRHDQRVCEECVAEDKAQVEPWPVPVARRIMDRVTAYQLVSMMEGVASRGTAARLSSLGVPVAGKTGTTNDGKDAWFVGFTPNLVAGCFVGYDNPRPMGKGGTGGGMCAPIFEDFMRDALKIRPAGTFRAPPDIVYATVDRSTGERLPDGSGGNTIREAFREGQAPDLYERAAVIGGDGTTDSFFSGGDLPMSLGGEDDDDGVDNAGVSDQPPARPRPSGGGDDDDLDGGLY